MRSLISIYRLSFFCLFLLAISHHGLGQAQIKGIALNEFTKEPIAYASVFFAKAGYGVITDSLGKFSIRKSTDPADTLIVKYVGFDPTAKPVALLKDTGITVVYLKDAAPASGVVIKSKFNKGLRWWKNMVAHKAANNPYRFENYRYELYNKLELDISNINQQTFKKYKTLQPFAFLLNNIDSLSEAKPFLPVFLTESLSDYYVSTNPSRVREEIKAVSTNGIKNETLMQFMGGVSQKINLYQDYVKLFDKEFISPLSAFADQYYQFKGADTQYLGKERLFHLFFVPKQIGTNTFTGDCWIHGLSWAVQKINVTVSPDANINFVNRLSVVQEFARINDSIWMFSKDKVVADLSPFPKEKLSFIGRKTATYQKVALNDSIIQVFLHKNKKREEVIVLDNAKENDPQFWQSHRHESLNGNETKVYQMIDTLKQMPLFKTYTNRLIFLTDGHKQIGMVEIGPWFKWLSANQLEKRRIRFDLGTTPKFSEHLRLFGYLAYGFGDHRWKQKLAFTYKIPQTKTWTVGASYSNDLDNGRIRFNDNDDATIDNLFSRFIRRKGVIQKFVNIESYKAFVSKEWMSNVQIKFDASRSAYHTFAPLPVSRLFSNEDAINTAFGIHLRYAPGEKKIVGKRRTLKLRGKLPIAELNFSAGLPGICGSEYRYNKLSAMFTQICRIPKWGTIDYMAYGGKIDGNQIPFMLLEVHPGNEIYYYSKQSFNLMNRFEYVSDRYVGFNIEHNFEKKLINLVPLFRKCKWRQFWNVKTVWGNLSMENRAFNRLEFGNYRLKTLRNNTYTEIGTGFDNIFRFFRIDMVWRFAPNAPTPPNIVAANLLSNSAKSFGVFGSFRVQF